MLGSFARGVSFTVQPPVTVDDDGRSLGLHRPSGPWVWPDPLDVSFQVPGGEVENERFTGGCRTRSPDVVAWNEDPTTRTRYAVSFDEPAVSADLLLKIRLLGRQPEHAIDLFRSHAQGAAVALTGATPIPAEVDAWPDPSPNAGPADLIMRISVPPQTQAIGLQWTIAWAASVDILGLHALAASDAASAAKAEADRKAAVDADADHEKKAKNGSNPGAGRTMLRADSLFRLTATLRWARVSATTTGDVTEAGEESTATWFFRTAPAQPVIAGGANWKGQVALGLEDVNTKVDLFDPRYLERYLGEYAPADHAQFVFIADHPAATFNARHIRKLAAKYGRNVALLLFRCNAAEDPQSFTPTLLGVRSKPKFPLVDVVSGAAAAYGCPLPPPSVRGQWPEDLLPSTPYELSVAFPKSGQQAERHTPHIRGITFTTSAFRGPHGLIESLGFTTSRTDAEVAAASATGHLKVAAPSAAVPPSLVQGDDAFEVALESLALPPLRAGGPARTSVLWCKLDDGGWAVRGVLLQATEPLVRAGGARMQLGQGWYGADPLDVRRLDRSATRALLLAAEPIVPVEPRVLRLEFTDRTNPHLGQLTVPAEPSFAGSALVGRSLP